MKTKKFTNIEEIDMNKPSRKQAEDAVRTLIKWIGDDVTREGLIDTPKRVVKSYDEMFSGYLTDPEALLESTFSETMGYDEMITLKDIDFISHCEHHLIPIIGKAHIAYLPRERVVGISKLVRVVDVFARRLQIQEKLTAQIAHTIEKVLNPRGVAVVIEAQHGCMQCRGVKQQNSKMVTSQMIGEFRDNHLTRQEFLSFLKS